VKVMKRQSCRAGKVCSVDGTTLTAAATSDLMILSDGRLLVHNLTPALAQLLQRVLPSDEGLRVRAKSARRGRSRGGSALRPPAQKS
jgi:hypothetical protein